MREDSTFDYIMENGFTEIGTYEISGNDIVSSSYAGILTSTISSDGTSIYCNEWQLTLF